MWTATRPTISQLGRCAILPLGQSVWERLPTLATAIPTSTARNRQRVEKYILKQEYGRAQEQFHKVSKFKKAVDSRRSARTAGAPAPPNAAAAGAPASRGTTGVHSNIAPPTRVSSLAEAPPRNQALTME